MLLVLFRESGWLYFNKLTDLNYNFEKTFVSINIKHLLTENTCFISLYILEKHKHLNKHSEKHIVLSWKNVFRKHDVLNQKNIIKTIN